MVQSHQTLETSIINDDDEAESDEDEEKDMIIEIDEKEMESNEDITEVGDEGSGEKDDLRDYDPESISEKIDELRNKNGKDYLDGLPSPQQKNKTASSEDKKLEESNPVKKVNDKKTKKVIEKKKTLNTVNVRKPDEPEAKSLADLGRSSIYGHLFQTLRLYDKYFRQANTRGVKTFLKTKSNVSFVSSLLMENKGDLKSLIWSYNLTRSAMSRDKMFCNSVLSTFAIKGSLPGCISGQWSIVVPLQFKR